VPIFAKILHELRKQAAEANFHFLSYIQIERWRERPDGYAETQRPKLFDGWVNASKAAIHRLPSGTRHTTQEHSFEVVIQYPHHPRAGERVTVLRRVVYGRVFTS
jgi:hypothetical protein